MRRTLGQPKKLHVGAHERRGGSKKTNRETKDAGFDHHLVKPAEPAELQKSCEAVQIERPFPWRTGTPTNGIGRECQPPRGDRPPPQRCSMRCILHCNFLSRFRMLLRSPKVSGAPIVPLFKERLFVYMSQRNVRYCGSSAAIVIGYGRPAGDQSCRIEAVDQAVRYCPPRPARPEATTFDQHSGSVNSTIANLPDSDALTEETTMCRYLPADKRGCLRALRMYSVRICLSIFLVFLTFVRTGQDPSPSCRLRRTSKSCSPSTEELAECVSPEARRDQRRALLTKVVMLEERIGRSPADESDALETDCGPNPRELRNPLAPDS